jgi:hypothetical protein
VIADLDTLLTALYAELNDRIIPSGGFTRRGPGKPPEVTDAELVCLAVAQVLRLDDERHWLRAAASRVGHLFPRLPGRQAAADGDLRRDCHRVRPGEPQAGWRAGNRPHDAGEPAR